MTYIPIFYNGIQISQLPVYDTLQLNRELMGAQELRADIELPGALHCPIGSYIELNGERYSVNTIPSPEKSGASRFKYNIVFESDLYKLYDKKLRHLNRKTFQYYGSPATLAQLIVDNINEINAGWTVGACDDLPEKSLDFDGHTCRTALDTIAETFKLEWQVNGKVISFVKQVGNVTTHYFEYGRGKGLYNIGYQYQNDKNVVTRAYGYGSTRNLPEGYRGGANQLIFQEGFLEKNVALYGVKEGDFEDEDVFPNVEGVVTAASAYNPDAGSFTISDSGLSFNLKENFSTNTAKISFLTGELQGQEFDILDFDNATKTIKIKVFTDSNNNKLPNEVFQAQVGDTYTLFDLYLPAERVAAAESQLKQKTQEWLDENSVPRVLYKVELDPLYARDNNIILNIGDKVRIKDDDLGIDAQIRVTKTAYPVSFPEVITKNTKIEIEIANFIPYTTTERVIADTIDNQKEIKVVNRTNAERARRNAVNLRSLQGRVFNPDGSLFEGQDGLVAGMAAFGYDSQNFNLNDVTIAPNAGADENSMVISAGQLIHRIYSIPGLGYEWLIAPGEWSGLDPAKFYYVYAQCSKSALTGTWQISELPVGVNDVTGYYIFNVGILYEVNSDGYRNFEFTKGMTFIVGDQITTGRIKDLTSQNYFDLTSGRFNLGDAETGLDWDVTTPATFTIRGALASKVIQVGSDGVINARISGITKADKPGESIRFAAGPNDEFTVLDNGSVLATKVSLGYGVNEGKPAGWDVTPHGIVSDLKENETDNFALIRGSSNDKEFSFATELMPSYLGGIFSQVGRIVNKREATDELLNYTNIALSLEASGADENVALYLTKGDLWLKNGKMRVGDLTAPTDYEIQYVGASGGNRKMTFKNGILVSDQPLP